MKQVIFDFCLFQFFFVSNEGKMPISHLTASDLIKEKDMHGKFHEGESPEGTPICIWDLEPENRLFLFKDKSGRGISSKLTQDQVMSWDKENIDFTDKLIHEFAQESEVGDVWESRTAKLIRIE